MFSLYMCVSHEHDGRLVVLAALICALGVSSAFALGGEALRTTHRRARLAWSAAAIVATASAIWATHFIAMLAFMPGLPVRFEITRTLLSLGVAIALVAAGAFLILTRPDWVGRVAGGSMVGIAIVAMHYTGMSAYEVQGHLIWDWQTVAASIVSGVGLAALSVVLPLSRLRTIRWLAPVALLAAVCLAHFLGMSALTVALDPAVNEPQGASSETVLTFLVANVALVIIALSLAAVWLSTRERGQRTAEDRRLRDLADIAIEGLLICDPSLVLGLNQSLEAMLGIPRDQVIGRRVDSLFPGLVVDSISDSHEVDANLTVATGPIPVKIISKIISSGGRKRTVLAVRDQRDRLRTEAEMVRLAHQDALTGLANRLRFNEIVADRCSSRRKSDQTFALLMLDLDRFKLVNDTLGHGIGDELLRRAAGRLSKVLREGDFLARLGGDEFVIVAALAEGLADMQSLAERITDVVSRPFIIEGQILEIGTSVGIAFAPDDGSTLAQLSRHADLALYRAKEEGRGTYRFFEADMNARMQARRTLEMDLRRAVARQEFEVVYQPQVDARTGAFDGAEALVRWNHPERGVVSPADFIPLAEELGLIGAIGDFVLRTACAAAITWPDNLSVAVNLSPFQFKDHGLSSSIAHILAEVGLPGTRLELEITENALLHDDGRTLGLLHALSKQGIRISMDDFGTGYSSLSYLRRFPFDKLKIDQSFVRQLPGDSDSVAIVQAITSLGIKLGMTVTAEGVETLEQRQFTAAEGCDQIQGYLISKPVSTTAIAALFGQTHPSAVAA